MWYWVRLLCGARFSLCLVLYCVPCRHQRVLRHRALLLTQRHSRGEASAVLWAWRGIVQQSTATASLLARAEGKRRLRSLGATFGAWRGLQQDSAAVREEAGRLGQQVERRLLADCFGGWAAEAARRARRAGLLRRACQRMAKKSLAQVWEWCCEALQVALNVGVVAVVVLCAMTSHDRMPCSRDAT